MAERRPPTPEEKEYMGRVASLGCVACRNLGYGPTPASVHHVRAWEGAQQRAGHFLVIPLCPEHHQHGGVGVALHACQKTWEGIYGTEQYLLNQTIGDVCAMVKLQSIF